MKRTTLLLASMALAVLLACGVALAAAGDTTLVSVSSSGKQANEHSLWPSISANGRFVVFTSYASNLVPGDTNSTWDIFVHDCQTGMTDRVNVDSSGNQADGNSEALIASGSISADGRYVAFTSAATNLVPGDTNGQPDSFVHDRQTGITRRVSLNSSERQANGFSYVADISSDGRYVTFQSDATNLVSGDTNNDEDVFLRNRRTGITRRVSVSTSGKQANGFSGGGDISGDGRYVAFGSRASNLVPGDTNGQLDSFVYNRRTNTIRRVSVSTSGKQANGFSGGGVLSGDGRYVAFTSGATNLVSGDTNNDEDVFLRNRRTGITRRASVSTSGKQGNRESSGPTISADGRYVAFWSNSTNFVAGDTSRGRGAFVHDRQSGITQRVSENSSGVEANNFSVFPAISADGHYVAYQSDATNLVANDINGTGDIFLHELDITAPRSTHVVPARGATGISRGVDLKATFSERVYEVKSHFKLYRKGSSIPVGAVVSPVEGTNNEKWVLNPNKSLRAGTTYIAKVQTGVVNEVGLHLDQNLSQRGNQPMQWTFRTRN